MGERNYLGFRRDGFSVAECASELGVSTETIRKIEKKALAKAARILAAKGLTSAAPIGDSPDSDDCRVAPQGLSTAVAISNAPTLSYA